jgi:arsenate reductase
MINILVLCTGNSCRSQMAHGFLQKYGGENVTLHSAGIETHGVNPFAIGIMAEAGLDISKHTSNLVDDYLNNSYDLVLTVCDHANEVCPIFSKATKKIHHNFTDPSKAIGSASELIQAFRTTRNEIDAYCKKLLEEFK